MSMNTFTNLAPQPGSILGLEEGIAENQVPRERVIIDVLGNVTGRFQNNGSHTTYEYNPQGRVTTETRYDTWGQAVAHTHFALDADTAAQDNVVMTFHYDAQGNRIDGEQPPAPSTGVDFSPH
jgi:YD repeat-containing protein